MGTCAIGPFTHITHTEKQSYQTVGHEKFTRVGWIVLTEQQGTQSYIKLRGPDYEYHFDPDN